MRVVSGFRVLSVFTMHAQEFGVVSYTLLMSLIEYKTLVLREDYDAAQQLLPSIPKVISLCAAHLICASLS